MKPLSGCVAAGECTLICDTTRNLHTITDEMFPKVFNTFKNVRKNNY